MGEGRWSKLPASACPTDACRSFLLPGRSQEHFTFGSCTSYIVTAQLALLSMGLGMRFLAYVILQYKPHKT